MKFITRFFNGERKSSRQMLKELYYKEQNGGIDDIRRKLSMKDDIWRNNDTLFYVPNYPFDLIQQTIVNEETYYDIKNLKAIYKLIPKDAYILDVGANIGNHSLYFATECKAKKIYAFEPIPTTFSILKKNIELNHLENIISPFNVGLSSKATSGIIKKYSMENIGATIVEQSKDGNLALARLDDVDLSAFERIDFLKIDIEGHEIEMLKGAMETLKRFKPTIYIETFKNNQTEVFGILENLGFQNIARFDGDNFVFIAK